MASQAAVDDLRARLGVSAQVASDVLLGQCLTLAEETGGPLVPTARRSSPLWDEAVQLGAIAAYERRTRGLVGVDPAGDVDGMYLPMGESIAGAMTPTLGPLMDIVVA